MRERESKGEREIERERGRERERERERETFEKKLSLLNLLNFPDSSKKKNIFLEYEHKRNCSIKFHHQKIT